MGMYHDMVSFNRKSNTNEDLGFEIDLDCAMFLYTENAEDMAYEYMIQAIEDRIAQKLYMESL